MHMQELANSRIATRYRWLRGAPAALVCAGLDFTATTV
jgi:hypothetical protein